MFYATKMIAEEISDKGICNLMSAVILQARQDYISSVITWHETERKRLLEDCEAYRFQEKAARNTMLRNRNFFQGQLFANALGAVGDWDVEEYIMLLDAEADREWLRYRKKWIVN